MASYIETIVSGLSVLSLFPRVSALSAFPYSMRLSRFFLLSALSIGSLGALNFKHRVERSVADIVFIIDTYSRSYGD